ncbi:MAG: N-acetylmuramoyl-L-alanine amidase [Chloroflexi bacterium]|nr:N-acetylmuramoyl-L-alanine amidase [Chloroflexota bacterium]
MPEENGSDHLNNPEPEPSASAIFVAMMRQAAARAVSKPAASAEGGNSTTGRAGSADDEEISLEPAPESHDIRRVRRRLILRRPHPSSMASGFFGTLFVVVLSTALVATLLMFFINPEFVNPVVVQGLQLDSDQQIVGSAAAQPSPARTPHWLRRIGIISGHRGKGALGGRDPGAICQDEYGNPFLTEYEINFAVATRVVASLESLNYAVELLDEYDPRLNDYRADALVSIHANTCYDFGELVTGFIVAISEARPEFGADAFLRECIGENFGAQVPLPRSHNITEDMTQYHAWQKIHPLTPGTILEMGYMLADRDVLTDDPDLLARAITNGILCFIENVGKPHTQLRADQRSARYVIPLLATPTPIFRS